MLASVTGHGIVVSDCRLKQKEFESRDNTAEVTFLHGGHLRVLVTQRYEIPERCHFYQLVVKLSLDFLDQYFKVLGHVLNGASMKQNEVKYFGTFRHVLIPLSLFINHCGCLCLNNRNWCSCRVCLG